MILCLVAMALRAHATSASLTMVVLSIGALLAGLPFWLPGLAWSLTALGALEAWYLLERLAYRLRGFRPATAEEHLLLGSPSRAVYVQEDDTLRLTAGLRSLVVSRGALELWAPHCLQALAVQAVAAAEPGWLVIGVGAAPIVSLAWAGAVVSRLGALLAVSVGSALVLVPFWIWGEGFARVAGRLFGVLLVTMLGCEMIASGLTLWGLGLLTGWAVAGTLHRVLAWEVSRVETRADRLVAKTGNGAALLEALEMVRGLGQPVAPRIAALKAAMAEPIA